MFGIAITGSDGEENYWTGAEAWNANVEDAAVFSSEANAEAAIAILRRAIPDLSPSVYVVELTGEDDD